MRVIEFKAIDPTNLMWYHGYYIFTNGLHKIITDDGFVIVNPKTVCQFSGLFDKHRNKIFEDDIVEWNGERFICRFSNGCFDFRSQKDGKRAANCFAILSEIKGNVHDKSTY